MVALTYYSFNYSDPTTTSAFLALDAVISSVSSAFHVDIADGFQAFYVATVRAGTHGDACAAGLLAMADGE